MWLDKGVVHVAYVLAGLRQAYADALPPSGIPNCAWEELLAAVEAASTGHPKSQGERAQPTSQLLRRPKVFSLALVWESPQVRPSMSIARMTGR